MKYVALLRGINVGGNYKVSMAELKLCFERAGYSDVRTYINSGNILFSDNGTVQDIAQEVEKHIEAAFGFAVAVLVLPFSQLLAIAESIPDEWQNNTEQKTDILFLWPAADSQEIIQRIGLRKEIEQYLYAPGALVWNIGRGNVTKSKLLRIVGTPLYKQMTVRNVNTVRKLVAIGGAGI